MNAFTFWMFGLLSIGFLTFVCNLEPTAYKFSDRVVAVGNPEVVSSVGSGMGLVSTSELQSRCLKWYTVRAGENQWAIAGRYGPKIGRSRWIKNMRQFSNKRVDDSSLQVDESICVSWSKVI